jgi:hypothetical protein
LPIDGLALASENGTGRGRSSHGRLGG